MNVEAIVRMLELEAHPEGGFYRETFRAAARVRRMHGESGEGNQGGVGASRAAGTAIYYLLPTGTFSAWHVVTSDEGWHFYDGAPLELVTIDPAGVLQRVVLGRDFAGGERPQHVVPAGWLQAARPVGADAASTSAAFAASGASAADYSLCGCTVSPGFEFADFAMPSRAELRARYPQHIEIVDALTRT